MAPPTPVHSKHGTYNLSPPLRPSPCIILVRDREERRAATTDWLKINIVYLDYIIFSLSP
jgi:hypothetical protein